MTDFSNNILTDIEDAKIIQKQNLDYDMYSINFVEIDDFIFIRIIKIFYLCMIEKYL